MSEVHARHPESIPSLDGIRALSVLIVVLAHSGFEIVPGGLGVTIFFFLSGYLITTLMLAEYERSGRLSIPKFYARRFFRLMPPLIITLAIAYSLTFSGLLPGGITAAGLAAQLLYSPTTTGCSSIREPRFPQAPASSGPSRWKSISTFSIRCSWRCCCRARPGPRRSP
jgi:peptidoglycan/LPS O-acetylase OafA/YrhL